MHINSKASVKKKFQDKTLSKKQKNPFKNSDINGNNT